MNNMTYSVDVKFTRGDKRVTYTKEYVITEICEGINGYKTPVWTVMSIMPNTDLIENKNMTKNESI